MARLIHMCEILIKRMSGIDITRKGSLARHLKETTLIEKSCQNVDGHPSSSQRIMVLGAVFLSRSFPHVDCEKKTNFEVLQIKITATVLCGDKMNSLMGVQRNS